MKQVLLLFLFTDEVIEARRGSVTFPRSVTFPGSVVAKTGAQGGLFSFLNILLCTRQTYTEEEKVA